MRAEQTRPGWVSGLPVTAVAVLGLLAGLSVTSGLWADPAGRVVAANLPDAMHYSWWLGHTPHAIGEGRNPLFTLDLNWPTGVSAMNNTTLLLPAVLLWPVTALFGPLFTLNLLNLLAVPVCTAAGYWALRHLPLGAGGPAARPLRRSAALLGAVAFAISPAVVNSLVGHVTMAFAPGLPVLVVLGVRAWAGVGAWGEPLRPGRTGLALGVVATLQVLTGEEVLFQAGMASLVLLLVGALRAPVLASAAVLSAGARRLAVSLGVALAVFLPLAAYPLHQQFFGRLRQHGSPFTPDYFGADPLSFVVPTDQLWLRGPATSAVAARYPGGIEEHLAYLGLPLLLLALGLLLTRGRTVAVRGAVLGLLVAMAFALGGRVWFFGTWTTLRGPYALLQALPVTEASLATRFGMLIGLFGAAVLALAVQAVRARPGRVRAVLAGALAGLCLAPLLPRPLETVAAPVVPEYFTGAARQLPAGDVVLVLPYPVATDPRAMRWQAAADYRFRMPGGYFLGPDAGGKAYVGGDADPATARLLTQVAATGQPVQVTEPMRRQALLDLQSLKVERVVLGPGATPQVQAALSATVAALLGSAPVADGGVLLWTDPLANL